MEIDLHTGEEIVDSWPLIYFAWRGCRYDGKCTITTNHICYDVKAVYGFTDVDRRTMRQLKIIIRKSSVHKVDVWRTFFRRRISITMQDGEKHLFSYSEISTGRIREALNFR